MSIIRNIREKVLKLEQNPKVKTIEIVIIVLMVTCIALYIALNTVLYRAYLDYKVTTDENYSLLSDEYHIYSTLKLDEEIEEMYVSYLSSKIKNAPLYKNNYAIILTDDVLKNSNPYVANFVEEGYKISAQTNKYRKTIFIDKNSIAFAFVHEAGHAVDNEYRFSKSNEFTAIYEDMKGDKNLSLDPYFLEDAGEFFAENYARFVNKELNTAKEQKLISYYESILNTEYMQF